MSSNTMASWGRRIKKCDQAASPQKVVLINMRNRDRQMRKRASALTTPQRCGRFLLCFLEPCVRDQVYVIFGFWMRQWEGVCILWEVLWKAGSQYPPSTNEGSGLSDLIERWRALRKLAGCGVCLGATVHASLAFRRTPLQLGAVLACGGSIQRHL